VSPASPTARYAHDVLNFLEIWENIFQYLPLKSLCKAAQVCRLFSEVSWPYISVDGSVPLDEALLRYFLSKKPQDLRICNCRKIGNVGPAILISCPNVARLRIQGVPFSSVGIEHIARGFLSLYARVSEFSLRDCNITDEACHALAECLPHARNLVTLNLSDNNITHEGLALILDALVNSTVTHLTISGNPLQEAGAQVLASFLKKTTKLQMLKADLVQLGSSGLDRISSALRTNKSLKALHLAENNIDARGMVSFADALSDNTTLVHLDLHANNMESEGAMTLAKALKCNRTLRILNLWDNRIGCPGITAISTALSMPDCILTDLNMKFNGLGPEGAVVLARALATNTSLLNLNLSYCYVGDVGSTAIGVGLETNKILRYLDLENNEIGDFGAVKLGQALMRNSTLRKLTLSNNRIGDTGAIGLAGGLVTNTSLCELDLSGMGKGANKLIGPSGAGKLAEALRSNSALKTLKLERNYLTSEHERLFRCGSCDVSIVRKKVGSVVRKNRRNGRVEALTAVF